MYKKIYLVAILGVIAVYSFIAAVAPINIALGQESTPAPLKAGTLGLDKLGFEMVYVPMGKVEMGISIENFRVLYREQFNLDPDIYMYLGEMGIFDVYSANVPPFWIDRYEVTIEHYQNLMQECIGRGECRKIDLRSSPALIDNAQKPQVAVTWYDALRFCSIRGARLPTEEEWEYAASGTENAIFPWGNTMDGQLSLPLSSTYPVGSKPKNVSWVGAFDMAGNAGEWVEDRFRPYNWSSKYWPKNAVVEIERVVRGGSWETGGATITTFERRSAHPSEQSPTIGFRCARSSDPRS